MGTVTALVRAPLESPGFAAMSSQLNPNVDVSKILIRPIASELDVPILAGLADTALRPDSFYEFRTRYGAQSVYSGNEQKLTNAIRDTTGRYFLFKAVLAPDPDPGPDIGPEFEAQVQPEGEERRGQEISASASATATGETIVGWALWRMGYLETPKMDPFAPKKTPDSNSGASLETDVTNVAISDSSDRAEAAGVQPSSKTTDDVGAERPPPSKPYYSNPDDEVARKLSNLYIRTIRGKRHICKSIPRWSVVFRAPSAFPVSNHLRPLLSSHCKGALTKSTSTSDLHCLVVHPSYQRLGIGQRLLDWGIETADRENIVAFLNSRPAGSRLYEKNGWKVVGTTEFDAPDDDLYVAPAVSMLRLPRRTGG